MLLPGIDTGTSSIKVSLVEPDTQYAQADKITLPGGRVAMRLRDEVATSFSALSEDVFLTFTAIDCRKMYRIISASDILFSHRQNRSVYQDWKHLPEKQLISQKQKD